MSAYNRFVRIDLARLTTVHPALPEEIAIYLVFCAVIALQRRHTPGVQLAIDLAGTPCDGTLEWSARDDDDEHGDRLHIVEHGAYAVALTLVHEAFGWTELRRLQRGEAADWLLADSQGRRVALEVSGTDTGDELQRLQQKLIQARRATGVELRSACVIAFGPPSSGVAFVRS